MPALDTLNFKEKLGMWTEFGINVDCSTSPTINSSLVEAFPVYKLTNHSGSNETATLAAPTKLGIPITVLFSGGANNIAVTVKDSTGATTYTDTLTAVGKYQEYISIETVNLTTGAKTYSWSHRYSTQVVGAGTTYYVDPTNGLDTNAGTSWGGAFKTMATAVATASAGDTILFRGTIAEATIAITVNNLTIRGTAPSSGSNVAAGNVWMELAAEQTELITLSGENCHFENICFRGPSTATNNTTYSLGVCVRLSGATGTQFIGCRFQGRTNAMAAIYSAAATTDDVEIIDCEFLYWNTVTYGAAIKGVSTGGYAYSDWRIINNTFRSCVTAIQFNAKSCEIRKNTFMEYGVPAAGGAVAAVMTMGIDLRSTSGAGGGANMVTDNYLGGVYSNSLYLKNADVATSDDWAGNWTKTTTATITNGYGMTLTATA
jgi:hypothetical protein